MPPKNTGGPGGQEQPRKGEHSPPSSPLLPSRSVTPTQILTGLYVFFFFFLSFFLFSAFTSFAKMQVLFFPHQLPEILGGAGPDPRSWRAFLFCVSPQATILPSSTLSVKTAIFLNNYFIISDMPLKIYPLPSLHSLPLPPQDSHYSKQKLLEIPL